jgi:hypothetical protein
MSSGKRPTRTRSSRKTARWRLHCASLSGSNAAPSVADGSGPRRIGVNKANERDRVSPAPKIQHENKKNIPSPPLPLHATSRARSSACSSGVGSGGCGPGYPFGNSVRLLRRTVFRMKAGDRNWCSMCGRSLSRNGVSAAQSMCVVVSAVVAAKRSEAEMSSARRSSGA